MSTHAPRGTLSVPSTVAVPAVWLQFVPLPPTAKVVSLGIVSFPAFVNVSPVLKFVTPRKEKLPRELLLLKLDRAFTLFWSTILPG
jgi:hypothetical protein